MQVEGLHNADTPHPGVLNVRKKRGVGVGGGVGAGVEEWTIRGKALLQGNRCSRRNRQTCLAQEGHARALSHLAQSRSPRHPP